MRTRSELRKLSGVLGGLVLLLLLAGHVPAGEPKADEAAKKPAPDPSACQLIIEGEHIASLKFGRDSDKPKTAELKRPGSVASLPAGKYRLEEVALTGGFACYLGPWSEEWLTLSAEKPCHLKVGAPLTPKLEASRQGRILELSYELLDSSGREYVGSDRSNPPRFTVYNGERVVGSGKFEYG